MSTPLEIAATRYAEHAGTDHPPCSLCDTLTAGIIEAHEGILHPAPPTPSQDAESVRNDSDRQQRSLSQGAEGDGLDAAWRHYDAMVAMSSQESEGREGRAKYAAMAIEARKAVESVIREPYEELVRCLTAIRDYDQDAARGGVAEIAFHEVGARLTAALTRIEESLGGRKDG